MKFALVALVLFWPVAASAAPCTPYGAGKVSGVVHRVPYYGAPGFGENPKTDKRGFYPVLKLDVAQRFCADKDSNAATAEEMQMIFLHFDKRLYGKHVTVQGEIFAAQTGWHHTPVMLHVGRVME